MLDFAIVGAGFGGIAMARALSAAGERSWCVFEKAAEVGGTWRENHYPGAACDVPSHLYSLAGAANPYWSRLFPQQPEIQAHLRHLAKPLIADDRIRFGQQLRSARWIEPEQHWALDFENGESVLARCVVLALGGLHVPAWPSIPGRDSFAGDSFHSAQWRHDVDLRDKSVVVIGTGASAVQFVPEIAKLAGRLSVVQRTPAWIIPRHDFALPTWLQRAFAAAPWLRKGFRGAIFSQLEAVSTALTHRRSGVWGRALALRHLHRQVPAGLLRAQLTPNYPIGCKRVLLSSDYYPSLQRDNVQLITESVERINPNDVELTDGKRIAAQVLIYGTGFKPLDLLDSVSVSGRDGRSLCEDWAQRPQAHLGINPHGYPNLHLLLGPNSALGHNSVLYMIETQVAHILKLHQLRQQRAVASVEATERAQRAYLRRVDRQFTASAWNGGCRSWYLDEQGQNIALWTGTCLAYRRLLRKPRVDDYRFV